MNRGAEIAAAVAEVYAWIDSRTAAWAVSCRACGRCCDFEQFDHRLFVTSVELTYFHGRLSSTQRKPMTGGGCPHRADGMCAVYDARFAGCRIFSCSGRADEQNRLSEEAIARLKQIGEKFDVPYAYIDLKTALNDENT
jgi:hypothetical protein